MINKIEREAVRRKTAGRRIMVERKRMQLRGPWKWEIMNSSPVSARVLPGDYRVAVRFKGWEGRWRLFRPAKGIWKLWPTSICLLHIRRHSTFFTFLVVVVVLVARLVALLPPPLPSPLPFATRQSEKEKEKKSGGGIE